MKTYILYVYCSRGGVPRDSGEHARDDYESDSKAISDLVSKARELLYHYDRVGVTIKEGKRTVHQTTLTT